MWKYRIFLIGCLLFCVLFWMGVFDVVDTVVHKQPRQVESPEERARIEKRMKYHGLNGVVVLRESARGWEFERDGEWCKL